MREYVSEFTTNWRPLLAASLGLSGGMALNPFVLSVLAPHLVKAMGWTKADFALTGMVSGLAILSYPLIGRMADRFGTKRVAGAGVVACATSYALMSLLQGSLSHYVAILMLQIFIGTATTGPVYLRLIVQTFSETRGVALALVVSSPALVAAIGSPLLSGIINTAGWQMGCLSLATYAAAMGVAALLLAPKDRREGYVAKEAPTSRADSFRSLLRSSLFRMLVAATMLVSLPAALANSQLALVLVENGISAALAGSIVSFFAIGVIAGRIFTGFALDRFAAEIVGAVALSLPAFGMLLLASPFDQLAVLSSAVLLIGLATGAEGDLLAYLIVRYFGLDVYSTALGLLFASVGVTTMLGAMALSTSIRLTGGYAAFLIIGAFAVLSGCAVLLRLRSHAISAGHGANSSNDCEPTRQKDEGN